MSALPKLLQERLKLLLQQVESLTGSIKEYDRQMAQIARTKYPETELLKQVQGVGALIALSYVLTVGDKRRFQKSRDVDCYLGLRPKRSQSGQSKPELRDRESRGRPARTRILIRKRRPQRGSASRWSASKS